MPASYLSVHRGLLGNVDEVVDKKLDQQRSDNADGQSQAEHNAVSVIVAHASPPDAFGDPAKHTQHNDAVDEAVNVEHGRNWPVHVNKHRHRRLLFATAAPTTASFVLVPRSAAPHMKSEPAKDSHESLSIPSTFKHPQRGPHNVRQLGPIITQLPASTTPPRALAVLVRSFLVAARAGKTGNSANVFWVHASILGLVS